MSASITRIAKGASPSRPACDVATDLGLLGRLRSWSDQESWREFCDLYTPFMLTYARRSGLSEAEAEDAVQETMLSVALKMRSFAYDPRKGRFRNWLGQLTGRRIADQIATRGRLGSRHSAKAETGGSSADEVGQVSDPAALQAFQRQWDEEWEQYLLDRADQRLRRQKDPRDYQVYDWCVVNQRPVGEACQMFGLNHAQVYQICHRMREALTEEIARLQERESQAGLGIDPTRLRLPAGQSRAR
ncbi:MAG: sigma-70 family RNA polymerase sigma factor [Verrucomicrobia bacterium]|nr:sigma-70 family RNA polymerase sigma factor [Verrucomicrobiota bacterium]